MAQGPHRPHRFCSLHPNRRSHRRTIHMDMGMQCHIRGFARIDIRPLAHLGQINLAIRAPMMVDILVMMILLHIRMKMLRPLLMRMRLRPGHRSEPSQHGNQQECQNVPHRPQEENYNPLVPP